MKHLFFSCLCIGALLMSCNEASVAQSQEVKPTSLDRVKSKAPSLTELIATFGGEVAQTIYGIPELEPAMVKTKGKAIRAAELWLAEKPPLDQKKFLIRFENILKLRRAVNEAAAKKENSLMELISTEPRLRKAAGIALLSEGLNPDGKSDYEITSQLSTFQSSALLTAVAREFLASPEVKQTEMSKRMGLKRE